MSKGQIQYVFMFILFIMVAGLIAVVGYKALSGIGGETCDLEKIKFRQEIESFIDGYNRYESVHEEEISLPCDFVKLCLVNNSVRERGSFVPSLPPALYRRVIETAAESDYNIFLATETLAEPIGFSEKLEVDKAFDETLCIEGAVSKLKFTGKGRTTLVKRAAP